MRPAATSLIPTLLLLAACGAEEQPRPHGSAESPIEPAARTIAGSAEWKYVQVDGTPSGSFQDDLHSWVIEAHFPTEQGWDVVPGYGLSDGTFTIPGAPEGDYWLRMVMRPFGQDFVWTDATTLPIGTTSVGQADTVHAPAQAPVVIRADGLSPWEDEDGLAFFAPDAVNVDNGIQWEIEEGAPASGDTSLDLTFNWNGRPHVRVEQGSPAFVVQSRAFASDAGVGFRAPVASFTPADAVQGLDGTPIVLEGSFASPPALEFQLAYDAAAYDALRTAIHPSGASEHPFYGHALYAHPGARDDGELFYSFEFPIFELADSSVLSTSDDLGAFSIPNPYPEEWVVQSFYATWQVQVPFPLDDGQERFFEAVVGRRSRTLSTEAEPLRPVVGPVGEVRLDGVALDTDREGIAPLAELSFDPPAIGSPTSYVVQVAEALVDPPEPYWPGWYLVANLRLPGDVTSVRMPHNLLRPGGTYLLVVRAVQEEGQDLRLAPYRNGVESAIADRVTSMFTVAAE